MSDENKLNLDDLDARARDLDDEQADEVSGGFFRGGRRGADSKKKPRATASKPSSTGNTRPSFGGFGNAVPKGGDAKSSDKKGATATPSTKPGKEASKAASVKTSSKTQSATKKTSKG